MNCIMAYACSFLRDSCVGWQKEIGLAATIDTCIWNGKVYSLLLTGAMFIPGSFGIGKHHEGGKANGNSKGTHPSDWYSKQHAGENNGKDASCTIERCMVYNRNAR